MTKLKHTVVNKCKYVDKWVEFWTDLNKSERWDLCSKVGYFHQALEDANMIDHYNNHGCKGIKITWEKIGPNWEIKHIGFKSCTN